MATESTSKNTSGTQTDKPLIVVVGETASGKSSLGLELAKSLGGEIISADSRLVYRGMDIGTAKPDKTERDKVPHHLIDIVEPDQEFTVSDFKRLALESIAEIRNRGRYPILVGGTGLYVDALVYDYTFRRRYDRQIRENLEELPLLKLQELAIEQGYQQEAREKNRRRLIRLLEAGIAPQQDRNEIIDNVLLVGLRLPRAEIRKNIEARVEQMFRRGLRKEVDELVVRYGWEHEALTGIGYREFEAYYLKEISMSQVKRQIIQHTLNYAKRQRTWFKRNPHINWFESQAHAKSYVLKRLKRV